MYRIKSLCDNILEEPLPAGGSCLLGSVNLSEFVVDNEFDYESFGDTVHKAVIALNEVLDEGMELHPLQEQRDSVRDWRQIGLGIFGLADMLIKMHITYGSKESIELCDGIAHFMINVAMDTSTELAKKDGAYPKYKFDAVCDSDFYIDNIDPDIQIKFEKYGLRNSQLLTIPPTGSISSMLGVSGGIEPIFANYYERKTESLHGHDEYYKVYTPIVKKYMEENNISDDSELPDFFVTAQNINYKDRIAMQSVWQKYIDASISSTVNVPNDFTVDEVMDLYITAWRKGLKGVTIFRDGCKRTGILTTGTSSKTDSSSKNSAEAATEASTGFQGHSEGMLSRGEIIKASDKFVGKKRTLRTGCGTLHCEAFFDPENGELREVYLSKGSSGGCAQFMVGLSRMVSLAARGGIDIEDIVDQLKSSGTCPSYAVRRATHGDTSVGSSCPVAVGNALIAMHEEMIQQINFCTDIINWKDVLTSVELESISPSTAKCPECGSELQFSGGCCTCSQCGYSKCE